MSEIPMVKGKLVAITGKFEMGRRTAVKGLEALGATLAKRVNSKTDMLFVGDNPGQMGRAARYYKTPVLDEAALVRVLGGGEAGQASATAPARVPNLGARGRAAADLEAAIGPFRAADIEAHGHTIGELFGIYVKIFAKRKDLKIKHKKFAKETTKGAMSKVRWLPGHVLAFYEGIGAGELEWSFEPLPDGTSPGYSGGRVKLRGVKRLDFKNRPQDWDFLSYQADAPFDDIWTYGSGMISYDPGETTRDATLVFFDNDAAERIPYGTAQNYITQGAKRAFVWSWQQGDGGDCTLFLNRLLSLSMPASTPEAELLAALEKRGASASQAKGLLSWLGDSAVVLLPRK